MNFGFREVMVVWLNQKLTLVFQQKSDVQVSDLAYWCVRPHYGELRSSPNLGVSL